MGTRTDDIGARIDNLETRTVNAGRYGDRGFTLIEILVALTILAALVAIVSPTFVSQIGRGELTQLSNDVGSMSSAIKSFRVDLTPVHAGDVEDLLHEVTTDGTDLTVEGNSYSSGQQSRWEGPYVELTLTESGVADATADTAFLTGLDAAVLSDLWRFDSSASTTSTEASTSAYDWVAVRLAGLNQADFDDLDGEFDEGDGADAGRYRFDGTHVYYLAAQK